MSNPITVIIDCETRSEVDLKTVGDWMYSKHPSTRLLCLAYKIDDTPTRIIDFRKDTGIPGDFKRALDAGALVEPFNINFEYALWTNILSERHNWPVLDVDRFRCSQARAAQFSLPRSLEAVSKALCIDIEKDSAGRKVMLQMCKPKKPSKKDPGLWYDDEERWEKLLYYCKRDVEVTYKIRKKLIQMTKDKNYFTSLISPHKNKELQIFKLNNKINLRGVHCDLKSCNTALELINKHEIILNNKLYEITGGRISSAGQVVEIRKYLQEKGVVIRDLQSSTIEKMIQETTGDEQAILKIRQQLSKSSTKKIKAMIRHSDEQGCIRNLLMYCGAARTGRFCVRKGTYIDIVRDLSAAPRGIKIEEVKEGDLAYCYDDDMNLCIRPVIWAGKTKTDRVIRIHYKGQGNKYGGYLDVTEDHKVRLIDGSYVEARKLKKLDRVAALSRSMTNGYSRLHYRNSEMREHRFIYGELNGEYPEVVHHKDSNKLNNNIDNLEAMNLSGHSKKHTLDRMKDDSYVEFLKAQLRKVDRSKIGMSGESNPCFKRCSKFQLLKSLAKQQFRITEANDVIVSHVTLNRKCELAGFKWKEVSKRYSKKAGYISRGKVLRTFDLFKTNRDRFRYLGVGYYRFKEICNYYGIAVNNHRIERIEYINQVDDVYDIEVKEYHNFIANELCVHNSGKGVQIQNFIVPILDKDQIEAVLYSLQSGINYKEFSKQFPDVNSAIASVLRGLIIPGEGNVFLDSDFSAIEARILFWLAEEQDGLDMYYNHIDIYKEMAGIIFDKSIEEVTKSDRDLGKRAILGCFTADTKVITKEGIKNIIEVNKNDLVWDGINWVKTRGCKYQGLKKVMKMLNVGVTPDHKILTKKGWKTAKEVVQKDNMRYLKSALDMANLPFKDMNTENVEASRQSKCHVVVTKVISTMSIFITWFMERVQDVIYVLKIKAKKLIIESISGNTKNKCQTLDIGRDFSIDYLLQLVDAIIRRLKDGITLTLKWIGSIMTKDIFKGIYGLSVGQITRIIKGVSKIYKNVLIFLKKKMLNYENVYDLLDCGTNNRFTIITDKGPMIVHNCGYGMGFRKFKATCEKYGIIISEELAQKAVASYRERFKGVKRYWCQVEEAAIKSILNPGKKVICDKVAFLTFKDYMFLCLPSGRALTYFQPKVKARRGCGFELSYTGYNSQINKFEEQRTWGGKLVENCTQSTARDFMVEAMFRVEAAGYPLVFTVHDQLIAEVPKDNVNLKHFTELMEIIPEWGKGCPIVSESKICARFEK